MVISVKLRKGGTDDYGGKEYHYLTDLPVKAGDFVVCPTASGLTYGRVERANVPESEIPEWLKGKLREIVDMAPEAEPNKDEIAWIFG